MGWKFTPFSSRKLIYPDTPVLEFLKSQEKPFRITGNRVIPVNIRTAYSLESFEGYETIHPLRVSQFLAALNSGRVGTSPVGRYGTVDNDASHLLDLVNTKYYLVHKVDSNGDPSGNGGIPSRYKEEKFDEVFEDKSVVVLENTAHLPRAFMVYDWDVLTNDENILSELLNPNFEMGKKIILEEEIGFIKNANLISKSKVEYLTYKETESILQVKTEDEGLLFVSDAWFPGWKAYVDGLATKIYRADYMFRAIEIPKGVHNVRFVYEPKSFTIGLEVTLISVAGGLIFSFAIYERLSKKCRGASQKCSP